MARCTGSWADGRILEEGRALPAHDAPSSLPDLAADTDSPLPGAGNGAATTQRSGIPAGARADQSSSDGHDCPPGPPPGSAGAESSDSVAGRAGPASSPAPDIFATRDRLRELAADHGASMVSIDIWDHESGPSPVVCWEAVVFAAGSSEPIIAAARRCAGPESMLAEIAQQLEAYGRAVASLQSAATGAERARLALQIVAGERVRS